MQDVATISADLQEFTLSSFELTKNTIQNLSNYDITPTSKLVLIYLCTCFNPKNKTVFPKIETIADTTGISVISVKRAVKELIKNGIILKAKCKTRNQYALTIQNDTNKVSKRYFEKYQNDTFHDHEQIKKTDKTTCHVVSFEKPLNEKPQGKGNRASRTEALFPIPQVIKDNPNIRNVNAYWASLSVKAKNEWYEKQKEHDHQQQVKRENEIFRRQEQERQEQELRKIKEWQKLPIMEKYTREQAEQIYNNFRKIGKQNSNLAVELKNAFNF